MSGRSRILKTGIQAAVSLSVYHYIKYRDKCYTHQNRGIFFPVFFPYQQKQHDAPEYKAPGINRKGMEHINKGLHVKIRIDKIIRRRCDHHGRNSTAKEKRQCQQRRHDIFGITVAAAFIYFISCLLLHKMQAYIQNRQDQKEKEKQVIVIPP